MKTYILVALFAVACGPPALAQVQQSHWEPGHVGVDGAWIDGRRVYEKPPNLEPLLSGATAPALTRTEQEAADRRAHRQVTGMTSREARAEQERMRDEELERDRAARRSSDQ